MEEMFYCLCLCWSPTYFGVPQRSVLGPIIFTIYTTLLANIIKHHNLSYHFYADDTQLYLAFGLNLASRRASRVSKNVL